MQTAEMVAEAPITASALESGKNQKELQSYTKRVQKITGTEFVVVMDMNGIRKTHPDPSKIGKKFMGGDEAEVLKDMSTSAQPLARSGNHREHSSLSTPRMENRSVQLRSGSL